jgi:hypothetical protein
MTSDPTPLRFALLHRGEPPLLEPDPWATSQGPRAWSLARAIASGDAWRGREPVTLVVRGGEEPVIVAIGRFGDATQRWLAAASQQLADTLRRVVVLDHAAAEAACERLGAVLTERFGADAARRWHYVGVPRGGLIVAGLLAYVLDLPRDRFDSVPITAAEATGDLDQPLVVVDDVAISGLRLSTFLRSLAAPRIVIATLHAHQALRERLVAENPRVEAFLSAYDLRDHAPAALGEDYDAWLARWQARVEPGTAWIGQADHVVYPWNEPDVTVWNPVSQREEPGWPVIPPERCLKRRASPLPAVQLMPVPTGAIRPHPDVVHGQIDGRVVVAHLGTGASFALEGLGSEIWRSLTATGDVEAVTRQLRGSHRRGGTDVGADVTRFAGELQAAGLLVDATA